MRESAEIGAPDLKLTPGRSTRYCAKHELTEPGKHVFRDFHHFLLGVGLCVGVVYSEQL